MTIEKDSKTNINLLLMQESDSYYYDFIPGVEIIEGKNSDNLILSYKKK